jgi:hypothetical protein
MGSRIFLRIGSHRSRPEIAQWHPNIDVTIGFEKLSASLGKPQKSLMRMFGPSGNPTAENLFGVVGVLQAETGVHLRVRVVADAA